MLSKKQKKIRKELRELTKNTNALDRVFIFQRLAKKYDAKHVEIMQEYFNII